MDAPHAPLTLDTIARDFNPAWCAAVMGTGAVPLALGFLDHPAARWLAWSFAALAAAMCVSLLVPWTLRVLRHRAAMAKDLDHPVATNFFPTMPIAMVIMALVALRYPELVGGIETARWIGLVLWGMGVVGIFGFGFLILPRLFAKPGITPQQTTFGWYIPPVSKLLVPVAGFELARLHPAIQDPILVISLSALGVGFFMFLFVGAMVYHRYIYHELPIGRMAPTFLIGAVPTAILAIVLGKLSAAAEAGVCMPINAQVIAAVALPMTVALWGFSFWWAMLSGIIILHHVRRDDLPYALSWWAFTFPLAALAIAGGVSAKLSGSPTIRAAYLVSVAVLLLVWAIVAWRTIGGVRDGRLFRPAH